MRVGRRRGEGVEPLAEDIIVTIVAEHYIRMFTRQTGAELEKRIRKEFRSLQPHCPVFSIKEIEKV